MSGFGYPLEARVSLICFNSLYLLSSVVGRLTLFVPGFFVIKYPGGALIGRTPQKFCKIVVMVLFF